MSEDPRTRTTTQQQSEPPAPKAAKLDLSVSKVLGGALAAMTAAGLGSRLSVAGTLVGAALASIIAAVAGAIYTASLHRTQEKVKMVWTGKAGSAVPTASDVSDPAPTGPSWAVTEPAKTATGWAVSEPTTAATGRSAADPTAVQPVTGWSSPAQPHSAPPRRLNWKGIVVGAFAMFAIAAAALTGFELISGHALSGGSGTTFTQVSEAKEPTKKPTSASTATASPTPSDTPSATTSETPEPTPSASSTPEPSEASTTPSTTSTPTATPTPSVTPSVSTPVPSSSATE